MNDFLARERFRWCQGHLSSWNHEQKAIDFFFFENEGY